jgi:hypothetical protein
MDKLALVTYCGLYCGLCSSRGRIPKTAAALRDVMKKEGYEFFGPFQPDFKEFWQYINTLADSGPGCSCRESKGTCGPPNCEIRDCARAKGVEVCPFCTEYPCARVNKLANGYTMMIGDGKRMKEKGLEAWISEQEARVLTGFNYVDIRCED